MKFAAFRQEIIAHAEDALPEECLGVIVDGKYERLVNVAEDPTRYFEMRPEDEARFGFVAPDMGKKPDAVVHSHPDGPLYPSEGDMRAQIAHQVPFVFVGHTPETGWDMWELGDHTLDEPLEGRIFRPGQFDCYHADRSWFWQEMGVLLPDIARRNNWWDPIHEVEGDFTSPIKEPAMNMYADNFTKWGFVELGEGETPQRGDVFLYKLHMGNMSAGAKTIETHSGVYLGDGRIYHHLPGRLSAIESADGWARKASRWIRYVGEKQ